MSGTLLSGLIDDLADEHRCLDQMLQTMDDEDWDLDTPAAGWRCRDQVSHLAFFDDMATLAITDPDGFSVESDKAAPDTNRYMEQHLRRGREMTPAQLLAWWQRASGALLVTLRDRGEQLPRRLPWYGPSMGAASFVTARLMESWAHGEDLADALAVERPPTPRLRHVAELGIRTRGFSYRIRGLEAPDEPIEVRLEAGDGDEWVWDAGAANRVAGPAKDFCLVVTQRRHIDDTVLEVVGAAAHEWLRIAQAFAGAPGTGRQPGTAVRQHPSPRSEEP